MGCPHAWLVLLTIVKAADERGAWWAYRSTNDEIDLQKSVSLIKELPIKKYEMSHDTIQGRVHYGVLAKDAEAILAAPYGEVVTREEAVPGAKGGLTRRVVDTTVVFTHALATLQYLASAVPDAVNLSAPLNESHFSTTSLLSEVEDYVLQANWSTAARLRPIRELAEEETAALRTRLTNIEHRMRRNADVTDYEFATRNATAAIADALAIDRSEMDHRLGLIALDDAANATREAEKILEALRRSTQLAKLLDEFTVAEAREKLREETAVEVAREQERQKAEAERLNEDVSLRMIRARGAETRQKLLEAITAVAAEVQRAAESLKTHPERLRRFVFGLIGLAAGYFTTREAALLARRLLTQYLMRPALVRESSFSMSGLLVWSLGLVWKLLMTVLLFRRGPGHDSDVTVGQGGVEKTTKITDGIILPEDLGRRLDQLAKSIRGARKLRAPLRHLLLFGPPGTGKTMVARRLSQISGLDWAIMSGGDVGPLGAAASTEIHAILNWARRSPKGLLLFVDEAEAALCDRGRPDLSEEAISALNAFLFHTSDPSYTFMLVLATNRPGDLDAAVLDRVDEAVEIPLPDEGAREKLLHLYFAMAFDRPAPSTRLGRLLDRILKRFRAPDVCIALDRKRAIRALAKKTEGYSGRECSKLMLSVQGAVYATERRASGELVLDDELWHRTVRWKLEEVKPRAAKAVADLRVAVE